MYELYIFLSFAFSLSLLLNYITLSSHKTSFEIVNDMGIGYNLGNSFDCFDSLSKIENPDDQITLNKNPIPTKDLILKVKKYGFKTIRIPITWVNFIDKEGNINSDWLYRIKEVVDWITKANMYCIININDDEYGNWLSNGIDSIDTYIKLWSQIANEFKDYDEHLIFESMNQPEFFNEFSEYDYQTLLNLSQSFVDTIRKSDNMNKERLLIITGPYADLDYSLVEDFKLPIDPANNLAISFQYYSPFDFTIETYFDNFNITDEETGDVTIFQPKLTWGNDNDYNSLFTDFNLMKTAFLDKKIPIIITATGVFTEEKKELKSIRKYLYSIFSLASEYEGIMSCLWDSSKNIVNTDKYYPYNMNYYNREKDEWYDDKIKNIFLQISKGKNLKISDYYFNSNKEIYFEPNNEGSYQVKVKNRKALKIILNVRLVGELYKDIAFDFGCFNNQNQHFILNFDKRNCKKEYDGTSTFTLDISNNNNCSAYIEVYKTYGKASNIIFNNLTIEFNDTFPSFDYKTYNDKLENLIN